MAPPSLRALTAAALAALAPLASALGQKQIISFEPADGALQLVGGDAPQTGQIRVSEGEYWGVVRAAGDLAVDFGRVTGTNFTLSNGEDGADAARYTFEPVDVSNNTVVSCARHLEITRFPPPPSASSRPGRPVRRGRGGAFITRYLTQPLTPPSR
jgi:hypothetical protein